MARPEIVAPTETEPNAAETKEITAQGWFSSGERVPYDPQQKMVLVEKVTPPTSIRVFRRIDHGDSDRPKVVWTTFLAGFPDGSFGWARVVPHLPDDEQMPKLYVEYVGQGDSDKPGSYPYGVIERADLVEAHWHNLALPLTKPPYV